MEKSSSWWRRLKEFGWVNYSFHFSVIRKCAAHLTQSRHRVPRVGIASNIMAVQEIEVVGVTEMSPNQRGVPDLPIILGMLSPQLRGGNGDTEEGQSKKRERKERTQGSKFALEAGCFLCLSWAVFNAVHPVAWCETRFCAPFVPGCGLGWEVLSLAIHETRPAPPPEKCLATINIVAVMAPGVMRQRALPRGYWGGDRGLVWLSHNNRGCPSPLGRPRLDPPERVTEWMATVTFSQACVLEYSKWEFQRLPTHTHTVHQISDSPLFIHTEKKI